MEVTEVKNIKQASKERATQDASHNSTVFFYKRRPSRYNLTLFKLCTKQGYCFVSNEYNQERSL